MKLIFMGTPEFAVPTLQRLIDSSHELLAVVTQPDRPVGRGKHVQMPPVKQLALTHNIPVHQPEKLRGTGIDDVIRGYAPDAIIVVAYGKIIPKSILDIPKFGCINIHGSLLPKYRGAAPIQWAIIRGERTTGVTIMQLDEGMDTGNMIASEPVDILDDDGTKSVSDALSIVGADLLLRVLDEIESKGMVESTPQDHAQATMAPILKKADGLIDWNLGNEEIILRIQGLQPWPTAFSFLHGRAWKFLRAQPFDDPENLVFPPINTTEETSRGYEPGRVSAVIKNRGFTVRTGDGHLLVTHVQPADKKPMSAVDAINGKLVKKGDEFISDPAFLEGTPEVK
jgi:methionyl-tRNA formyltransferase